MRFARSRLPWLGASLGVGIVLAITTGLASGGESGDSPPAAPATNGEGLPALANMAVFSRAQTPADQSVHRDPDVAEMVSVATENTPGVPAAFVPGAARPETGRLLLSELGTAQRKIWAVGTTKGRVCAGLTAFSAGCIAEFAQDRPITVTVGKPSPQEPLTVWGLIPDEVGRIQVVVNGTPQEAITGSNAFFYQLGDNSVETDGAIEAIVVGFRDATRQPLTIKLSPTPAPPRD